MHDETKEFLRRIETGVETIDNTSIIPHGERPCPICGKHMLIENEDGIQTDVCANHGVWLDTGELASIMSRSRLRERASKSRAVRKAKTGGIWAGATYGIWAFVFDELPSRQETGPQTKKEWLRKATKGSKK